MTSEQKAPVPPVNPPPVGKNYVFQNGKWEIVDNPVFNIKPTKQEG